MKLMAETVVLRKRDRSRNSLTIQGTLWREVGCANQSQATSYSSLYLLSIEHSAFGLVGSPE